MELHGKGLWFIDGQRPATRFFFAYYFLSIMRTVKLQTCCHEDRLREFADIRPFRMPGRYLRKSFVLRLWDSVNASHLGDYLSM